MSPTANPGPDTQPSQLPARIVDVLIVGAGPVGSALAIELGMRGVDCVLVDRDEAIVQTPVKAMFLNMRTLEHFRQWGCADALRAAAAAPRAWQSGLTIATSLTGRELGSMRIHRFLDADLEDVAAETAQMVMQPQTVRVLRQRAAEVGVTQLLGWSCSAVTQNDETAEVQICRGHEAATIRTRYVVGCDGGSSLVRRTAGIQRSGAGGLGAHLLLLFKAPQILNHPTVTPGAFTAVYNPDMMGLGVATDTDQWCIHVPGYPVDVDIDEIDVNAVIAGFLGENVPFEVTYAGTYKIHERIADAYRAGRFFIAGDAAHLYAPFGGHNMNSGIGDAVNLGWKLAARLQGWGGETLLDSYEAERRPIAVANAKEATHNVNQFVSAGPAILEKMDWDELRADTLAAEQRRRDYGEKLWEITRREWVCEGIVLDQRYTRSPAIVPDEEIPPTWHPSRYHPSAKPGHRAPHARLSDGRSLYDLLGNCFTLLALPGADPGVVDEFVLYAKQRQVPLEVCQVHETANDLRALYGAQLTLIRPDQHVAWRGQAPATGAGPVLDIATGQH